jgi:P2-related tail formation protein
MLEAYSFDIETTIDYFVKQREAKNTKPIVKPSVKSKEVVSSGKKNTQTVASKQKQGGETTEVLPSKPHTVAAQDMNAMGFASQNIEKTSSITKAPLGIYIYMYIYIFIYMYI